MTSPNVWETPSFIDIDMSAEIGGYQGDDDWTDRPDVPDYFADNSAKR